MKQFFATATATTAMNNSAIRVEPKAYLHLTTPVAPGSITSSCVDAPMVGMWVEANAQMFSYGLTFNGKSASASVKFSFEATSPHYPIGSTGSDNQLNPARFKMFIPQAYVTSLGYSSDEFTVSALRISTADNQTTSPSLTPVTGGFILDFGIKHYSSPNPVVEIYNKGAVIETPATVPTTTTVPPTTVPVVLGQLLPSVSRGKSLTSARLVSLAGLTKSTGSKVLLRIAGSSSRYCRVVGTSVRATRTGTCKVSVSVVQRTGKKATNTVTLKIV